MADLRRDGARTGDPATGGDRDWVFLAPAPADVLSYNPANHAEPDFAKAKQPFWANEQTHPDSQP